MQNSQDDVVVIQFNEQQIQQMQQAHLQQTKSFLQTTSAYRIENWYQHLKQHTFKSLFFQLTAIEAYCIYSNYYEKETVPDNRDVLRNLELRVDQIISNNFEDEGCFAKLSTRSPKDYSWDFRDPIVFQEVVKQLCNVLILNNFDKIEGRKLDLNQWNIIYLNLLEITKNRLKILTGSKLVQMFCKSQRVIIDIGQLETAEQYLFRQFDKGDLSRKDIPLIKVCLREWRDFKWQFQFRCFYNNYSLTAITPYVQDAYYHIDQHLTQTKIVQFFKEIKPKLQTCNLPQGVMDICFIEENEVKLIEVNTFDENSRGSLFNWKNDRNVLENGPLEIRTLKAPSQTLLAKLPTLMGMVEKGSVDVVKEAVKRINPTIDLSDIDQ